MTPTAIKERPILFSGAMVRALLDGSKTQTRRVIKDNWWRCLSPDDPDDRVTALSMCPYGVPDDRLYVRETWRIITGIYVPSVEFKDGTTIAPEFDDLSALPKNWQDTKWRPSIHMPRWASRITLEVTDVRVQRVQEITEHDVVAEGLELIELPNSGGCDADYAGFRTLWDSINDKRGFGWDTNPWVWAVSFRKVER